MTLDDLRAHLAHLVDQQTAAAQPDGYVDCEERHIEADRLLVEYINDPEVTILYDTICRWYA